MQIVGGIGYTDVFPIERMLRDIRLTQIWTGTNEIMDLLIQHEYYQEVLGNPSPGRLVEADAAEANADNEKVSGVPAGVVPIIWEKSEQEVTVAPMIGWSIETFAA